MGRCSIGTLDDRVEAIALSILRSCGWDLRVFAAQFRAGQCVVVIGEAQADLENWPSVLWVAMGAGKSFALHYGASIAN